MIKRYRTMPVEKEALQYTGDNGETVKHFAGDKVRKYEGKILQVITKQGWSHLNPNDYLIKNPDGEFYPCNPRTFNNTYEEVGG